jgi:Putative capsular polysaccharide synthesis protein
VTAGQLAMAYRDGLSRRPLLLVYQMGKVASQTVEAALGESDTGRRVVRLHFIAAHNRRVFGQQMDNAAISKANRDSLKYQIDVARTQHHAILARRMWRALDRRSPRVEFIVGIREPIGLLLAAIFQTYTTHFASLDEITAGACRDILLQAPSIPEDRRRSIAELSAFVSDWFDVELKAVTGIDVYATPFPTERGYAIYENENARALVYRFENLGAMKPMLEEFLGSEIRLPANKNVGGEKDYGAAYRKVKEQLRLPRAFVEKIYAGRMFRHFYSEAERQRLAVRWACAS